MRLEVYVDPNGIYYYEDVAVMFIPAVDSRLNSQSVFLVFDNSDIPRVQSELGRGNKLGQNEDGRPFWTKCTAQSTTNGGEGCDSKFFYRWLMVTDSTEDRYMLALNVYYVYVSITTLSFVLFAFCRLVMHLNDIPLDCRRANLRLGDATANVNQSMFLHHLLKSVFCLFFNHFFLLFFFVLLSPCGKSCGC